MSDLLPGAHGKLSADAVKLLLIFAVFNFVVLFLLSRAWFLDFSSFYTAGGLILHGHGHQLYSQTAQAAFQLHQFGIHGVLPFNHFAFEALLFVPLASLPFPVAVWLWRLFSVGLFAASCKTLADVYHLDWFQTCVLAFGFFPVVFAIVEGQDSAVLLFFVVTALSLLQKDQPVRAGFVLTCALFKPHLILPLAVFMLWKRGWRFLAGLAAGTLVFLGISTLITGVNGWMQLAAMLHKGESKGGGAIGVFPVAMPNLHGLFFVLGLHGTAGLVVLGIGSVLLCVLCVWALRSCSVPARLFPVLVLLTMLISFHLNLHDLSLVLIPMVYLFQRCSRLATIAAAVCYSIAFFGVAGYLAYFALVLCWVLWVTLRLVQQEQPESSPAN